MKHLIGIILIIASICVSAQNPLSRELEFIQHLVNQEEYTDAIYYINRNFHQEYPLNINDSLNYLKGWSQYAIKDLENSATSLLQVSSDSPLFYKSRFFAAYNLSYLGRPGFSSYLLKNLDTSGKLINLQNFEMAGNALLERKTSLFESYFKQIETSTDFSFSIEKDKLQQYSFDIKNYKPKSMVAGALMSAIIPGSGKIYAGKTGEGISTFLIVAATGATAWENQRKLGFKHAKTIVFSSLFAVLYIGNIYGTVFTVKLVNEEFNHEMDNKILFNMHIPLRNLFN